MKDYVELESVRRKLIGYFVEHPTRSDDAVESVSDMQRLDERFHVLQSSSIGKTSIHTRISNIFAKEGRDNPRVVLDAVNGVMQNYLKRTRITVTYGILSPLAFSAREDLSKVMGHPKSPDVFSVTWNIHFQQLSAEKINTGLLDATGITKEELDEWWFGPDTAHGQTATDVWDDLKRLASRLVKAFNQSYKGIYSETLESKIRPMRHRLIKLGAGLARLVHIRHESTEIIRQLFELLVPYVDTLECLRKHIENELDAQLEMEKYANDSKSLPMEELGDTTSLDFVVSELRKAEIPEISLNQNDKREWLGGGSFSDVWKYSGDGSQVYAVKLYKYKAGPQRTKERFLREATRWYGLDHENINYLLGFCILPFSDLPALVTRVHSCTLQNHIDTQGPRVSEMERLGFLLEIAIALRYLHEEKNMAHGDLRPDNVLLDNQMTVKLSDFGMSYIEDSVVKTTSQQKTNKEHLAPELKETKEGHRQVSIEGDIYAFGCCFLEVCYGESLDKTTVSRLKRMGVHNGKGPKLPKEKINVQLGHWELLERTFDNKPEKRPSAKDLVDCMRKFMSS
ncbi:hypothetical protein A7U60_g4614 [Sanghuangporus baumii]|uniref:Protein kinase domain-containing protein n=1 Tax=Sanghuangporus baumii TaxID=108892 RepID=A0A9Q5HY94_SANBA|nr:hypothetical protein A7U60_g4614 [Sanghuangporus baumii]